MAQVRLTGAEMRRTVEALTNQLQAFLGVIAVVDDVDRLVAERTQVRAEIAKLTAEVQARRLAMDGQVETHAAPLRRELEGLTKQVQMLREQYADLARQRGALEGTLASLRQQLADEPVIIKKRLDALEAEHAARIGVLQGEVAELEARKQKVRDESLALQRSLSEATPA